MFREIHAALKGRCWDKHGRDCNLEGPMRSNCHPILECQCSGESALLLDAVALGRRVIGVYPSLQLPPLAFPSRYI